MKAEQPDKKAPPQPTVVGPTQTMARLYTKPFAESIISDLIDEGIWFCVEPLPDGWVFVMVKPEFADWL